MAWLKFITWRHWQFHLTLLDSFTWFTGPFHLALLNRITSHIGWFVAFGDSVGALTVSDVTEIHQLAGFMGRLYTRETTRENRGRRRINWLNSGYYMYTQYL